MNDIFLRLPSLQVVSQLAENAMSWKPHRKEEVEISPSPDEEED